MGGDIISTILPNISVKKKGELPTFLSKGTDFPGKRVCPAFHIFPPFLGVLQKMTEFLKLMFAVVE